MHIEAHSGQHHLWIRQLPLSFKKYALTTPEWMVAVRRRLMIDVFAYQSHCTFCKGGWCDVKGEHAIMCGGGHSRTFRHNTIRDIIAKAARDVGCTTDIEHGGGLGDERRPGDVIIYNWRDGKHLLIDVAVINPQCSTRQPKLISKGVGAAATAYEQVKKDTYSDLDFTKYDFLPFIVEASGGMGKAAHGFCKELKSRRESLNCCGVFDGGKKNTAADPLLVAISVELQRANSRMIIQRTPQPENLIESEIEKCKQSVAIKRDEAIEDLRLDTLKPKRLTTCEMSGLSGNKVSGSSKKTTRAEKGQGLSKTNPRKKEHKPELPSEQSRNGINKAQVKLVITPPLPEPPPHHGSKEASCQGCNVLFSVDEERRLAPESLKSRCTSTSSTQAMPPCLRKKTVKKISWEPPLKLAEKKNCGPRQ